MAFTKDAIDSAGTVTTGIGKGVRLTLGLEVFRNCAEISPDCGNLDSLGFKIGTCT
jgi:hypothetical protein